MRKSRRRTQSHSSAKSSTDLTAIAASYHNPNAASFSDPVYTTNGTSSFRAHEETHLEPHSQSHGWLLLQ